MPTLNIKPEAGRRWRESWSLTIARAIAENSRSLLAGPPKDLTAICPGYAESSEGTKLALWVGVFAEIARRESAFNPSATFDEPAPLSRKSEGLLMLSYGVEQHGNCAASRSKANIRDPDVNLVCGVAVMRSQVRRRAALFPSENYHWSVLTSPKFSSRIKAALENYASQLPEC